MEERCPSPIAEAHHEPQATVRHSGLVRMSHHAGVAEGGTFERILARERRAEQQPPRLGELALGIEAIGELVRVLTERVDEGAVTVSEAGLDIVQGSLHLVVAQGQDASHDGRGARLLQVESLLAGHEEHRDDTGPVGGKALGAAPNPICEGRAHREAGTSRDERCRVEIRAKVDSVPWLRLGPRAVRPS